MMKFGAISAAVMAALGFGARVAETPTLKTQKSFGLSKAPATKGKRHKSQKIRANRRKAKMRS